MITHEQLFIRLVKIIKDWAWMKKEDMMYFVLHQACINFLVGIDERKGGE